MPIKFSRRRVIAGFGSGALLLLEAACNSRDLESDEESPIPRNSSPPGQRTPTSNIEEPVAKDSSPTPLPYDGIEVSIRPNPFDFSVRNRQALKAPAAELKDLTGIALFDQDCSLSWPTSRPRCKDLPAPDIYFNSGIWMSSRAAWGQLFELDGQVTTWGAWEDLYPVTREQATYGGHIYGIPLACSHRGSITVRPSMFENAGLRVETPSSWEELNEIAPKLTIRDGEELVQAGINLQHHSQTYEDWLVQAGGKPFSTDLSEPSNNTPEGHIALLQHVRHGLVDQTMPVNGVDSGIPNLHAFCAGNVAIQPLWPGNVGNCQEERPEVFRDLLVGPPLKGPESQAMQIFVDSLSAEKSTKHPDATFEVLKYLASPGPYFQAVSLQYAQLPCRTATEIYSRFQNEPWKTLGKNVQHSRARQITHDHFTIQSAMSRWVEAAALGNIPVGEALQGMDAEVTELITGN